MPKGVKDSRSSATIADGMVPNRSSGRTAERGGTIQTIAGKSKYQAVHHHKKTISTKLKRTLAGVFRERRYQDWLLLKNQMLGNRTPISLIQSGREDLIFEVLERLRLGDPP